MLEIESWHKQGICLFCGRKHPEKSNWHAVEEHVLKQMIAQESLHIAEMNNYDELTSEDWQKQIKLKNGDLTTVAVFCSPTNDAFDSILGAVRFDSKNNQIIILAYEQCNGSVLMKFDVVDFPLSGCVCVNGDDLADI